MAVYQGVGRLIGVNSYVKDDKVKVIYSVIEGEPDVNTKLFKDVEVKQIIEEQPKIKNPQFLQRVKFKLDVKMFGAKAYSRAYDIEAE